MELKDILAYTGIEAESIDDFKEKFSAKYYTPKQIHSGDPEITQKFFGRAFGDATTGVKQIFDKLGVQITGKDLEQPIEKVVELGAAKLNEIWAVKNEETVKTAGLTADERLAAEKTAREKAEIKAQQLEEVVKQKGVEFETKIKDYESKFKNDRLSNFKTGIVSKLNILPDVDQYKKKGWLTEMEEKYVIDYDEKDNTPYIATRADNKRVPSGKTHDAFMTPEQVYEADGVKAGIISVNQNSGKPAPVKPGEQKQVIPPSQQPATGRKIASAALAGL